MCAFLAAISIFARFEWIYIPLGCRIRICIRNTEPSMLRKRSTKTSSKMHFHDFYFFYWENTGFKQILNLSLF